MSRPRIDREVVLHVAKLASLSLGEAEVERFAGELERIVAHIEQLDGVDTRDVPATANAPVVAAGASAAAGATESGDPEWRADEPRPCLSHEEALAQAPRTDGGGFSVPAFVE